jgi:hypothetical protein
MSKAKSSISQAESYKEIWLQEKLQEQEMDRAA